jgi:hypothetical protein
MLAYAIDNQAPTTIILITGDRDFAYAVSVLRLRRYRIVIIAPPIIHISLKLQASVLVDWRRDILGNVETNPESSKKSSSFESEGNPDYFTNSPELDRKTLPTSFSCSIASAVATESSERVEDANQHPGSLTHGDTSHYGPRSNISVPGVPWGHTNVSGPPGGDPHIKLMQSATKDIGDFRRHPSRRQMSGEPIAPVTTGHFSGVSGRLHTSTTASGDVSLSTAEQGLEFGIGSGDIGSRDHVCGVSDSRDLMSPSVAKPYQFGTTNSGAPSVLPSFLTEIQAGRSLWGTPKIQPDNADDAISESSSFITSNTPQTCAVVVETLHSPSFSKISYDTDKVAHAVTANSLPGPASPRAFAEPLLASESPSVASLTPLAGEMRNDLKFASASSMLTDSSVRCAMMSPEPGGTSDKAVVPVSSKTLLVPEFRILVEQLELQLEKGILCPLRSVIAEEIMKQDTFAYTRAGAVTFGQYITLALKAGITTIGGVNGEDWISLHPAWQSTSDAIETSPPEILSKEMNNTSAYLSQQISPGRKQDIAIDESAVSAKAQHPDESLGTGTSLSSVPTTNTPLDPTVSATNRTRVVGDSSLEANLDSEAQLPKSMSPEFTVLVEELEKQKARGIIRPSRSTVAVEIVKQDPLVYSRAGVSKFKEYVALAAEAKVVTIGGTQADAWISLSMPSEQYTGQFKILVEQLQKSRQNGVERPLRSAVGSALVAQCQSLYQDGGFKSFKDYVTAAEKAGIIQLGGSDGRAWISMCPT